MEIAKLILEFLRVLINPIIFLVFIWLFRKHIVNLLNSIKKLKWFGIDAEFEKRINEKIEQVNSKISNVDDGVEKEIIKLKEEIGSVDEEVKEAKTRLSNEIEETIENDKNKTMLVFAVGLSIEENLKYRLYYDPAVRNHNYPFRYIGLYLKGEVMAIGEVKKIVYCDYNKERDILIPIAGKNFNLTQDEESRIKETIKNTDYYDLKEGNKFFLVDNFYQTHYWKHSESGLRAKKYFWLDKIIDGFKEGMTAEELAKALDGKGWE